MNVLSLCDGMSCGHLALDKAGIEVDKYFAAEIKEVAIRVTKDNYPDTIHIGDVNKISFSNGILHTEVGDYNIGHIDIVMFGSPCQTFSIAMKEELRTGLLNKEKSGLFLECHRILKEVNPTYFFMENVGSMKNSDRDFISSLMGVEPIRINSSLVSAQLRDRYYWTNIPGASIPEDKGITFQSILENGFTDREKARCLLVSESRPLMSNTKRFHRYTTCGFINLIFDNKESFEKIKSFHNENYKGRNAKDVPAHSDPPYDHIRILTQTEMERLQTVPEGYTKCLTRNEAADVLGDGWTVDVIAHIFKGIKTDVRGISATNKVGNRGNSWLDDLLSE